MEPWAMAPRPTTANPIFSLAIIVVKASTHQTQALHAFSSTECREDWGLANVLA
jgi:hypothetical protein